MIIFDGSRIVFLINSVVFKMLEFPWKRLELSQLVIPEIKDVPNGGPGPLMFSENELLATGEIVSPLWFLGW